MTADEGNPPESDDDDDGETPADEPPPPKIIKIEDALVGAETGELLEHTATESPFNTLDGKLLGLDEAVAAARLDSELLTPTDGEAVLVGEAVTDLAQAINDLSGTRGLLRVRRLEFAHSLEVIFTTAGPVEQTLNGPQSRELKAAQLLSNILSSRDEQDLFKRLEAAPDEFAARLEPLLKILYESRATLDFQTPRARPMRVGPERAVALYSALRRGLLLPAEHLTFLGQLVGAIADTRDFKVRLDDPWRGKRIIDGKFREGLEPEVERFFNQRVVAHVLVEGEHRPGRALERRFTLEGLRAPDALQPSLPM